ncbi:EAL domain-containing protein [Stappia sp. BW2]|uniref:putative bifunctional diguanylate cyclase/phosphodiesterase n=1 Tax=Stappia sp. BW2 TaxID=2592622 RepID=UPI0011DEB999|nr:EAL domain-containing protein [Stappia sp. BW2]TYC67865.1 EAL domain-containing protein [Stappia sp. BW2]
MSDLSQTQRVTEQKKASPTFIPADGKVDQDLIFSIYDRLDTGIWVFDFDEKCILWANRKALEFTGADSLEELRSRDMGSDMSHSVAQRLRQYQQDFTKHDVSFSEIWTLYPKGKAEVLQVVMSGIRLNDGRMALLCEGRPHHEQQPETLRSAEALMHTTVMISLFSEDGHPLYRNTAARAACTDLECTLWDHFIDKALARKVMSVLSDKANTKFVAEVLTCDGLRWHEITIRRCHDAVSGKPAFLLSEIDVTELHQTKERAQYLASHDALTGLSNRTYLKERLMQVKQRAQENDLIATLYLVDLDDFKMVNDTLGHAAGDHLLQLVATRLKELAGQNDIVARLGGDEFLICHLSSPESPRPDWFGQALLQAFATPQMIEGKPRHVGLSIGYVHYPMDGSDIDELMRHADLALYQAKSDRKHKCVRYKEFMRKLRDKHLSLKKDLERAIRANEFLLYYQPIACTRSQRIVGAEALLRWQHPEKGLVGPDDFISVAEETGLINEIGTWVSRNVADMQSRLKLLDVSVPLSMNVSPKQLSDPKFLTCMENLPKEKACNASEISLEITESVLLGDIPHAYETLMKLKAAGYRIVIDDFGTGYSNLAYLHNYPIDGIKIDRMFMNDIATGGAIVRLILSLASALDASVVAEGVETIEQRSWLSENGCNLFQGFLYSRPVPEEQFIDMLQAQVRAAAM